VSWENICKPKDHGALGIKYIILFNESLVAKWRWSLFHQRELLWVWVLESKYKGWIGLCEWEVKACESNWWRDVKLVYGRDQPNWFDSLVKWNIGERRHTRFWENTRLRDKCLKVKFVR